MEALTPTFSLLSEAPVAVYEVAFSKMRIAAVTGASAAGDRGISHLPAPSGPALPKESTAHSPPNPKAPD